MQLDEIRELGLKLSARVFDEEEYDEYDELDDDDFDDDDDFEDDDEYYN